MNVYAYIAAALVIAGCGTFFYLWRKDKETESTPPPPPRDDHRSPPPPPKPGPAKSAEQVFRETFPGMRVPPHSFKPFCLRVEASRVVERATGEMQPGLRLDVSGGIQVGEDVTVDLIVTMEDVTEGAPQPVYATQDRYQDEQTGQFVLRTSLGKVTKPGRVGADWTSVGVIPYAHIQAPKSGARVLRVSCLAIPATLSSLSVVNERLRHGMLVAASANFKASLARKGYVEKRFARQHAAGLVVCLGFAFAARAYRDARRAEPAAQAWIGRWLEQLRGEDERQIVNAKASLEVAMEMARQVRTDLRMVCRELLAYEVAGMAEEGLRLCVEIGKVDGVVLPEVLPELRGLCRELGLGLEGLQRHAAAEGEEAGAGLDQEHATLIGLDLSWDSRRIRRHLLDQFMKWNARHPRDATEREAISRRLEAIAKLRQRYL